LQGILHKEACKGETLPIVNKPKHPKKRVRGNTRNKMKGPTFKKTKEPKRVNYKWNLKIPNPFLS
jgi:hypothetical protein